MNKVLMEDTSTIVLNDATVQKMSIFNQKLKNGFLQRKITMCQDMVLKKMIQLTLQQTYKYKILVISKGGRRLTRKQKNNSSVHVETTNDQPLVK